MQPYEALSMTQSNFKEEEQQRYIGREAQDVADTVKKGHLRSVSHLGSGGHKNTTVLRDTFLSSEWQSRC